MPVPASVSAHGASRPLPPAAAPRRTRPIYRVFVSSTWLDLQPERRALMEALNRMEEMRFVGMEFFGNRPDDTHDASIDQVDLCELFVGIIGHRYGSGITEAEYRRARQLGLPCFVYFKRETGGAAELTDGDPARAAQLAAFKEDLLRGHTVKEFAAPEELAANATADLHNWVAARWISLEPVPAPPGNAPPVPVVADADRTNLLRLLERIEHDWVRGVLEASLHHRVWLELGLDWREGAVEHPWDRIVVAQDRPIQTLAREDSIAGVFAAAQNTLLVLGEPGAGKTTTLLELARDLIAAARSSPAQPAPAVLALSTWTGESRDFADWVVTELGLRYQVPKRIARDWVEGARLTLLLDGLDEVPAERRAACVAAINAFEQAHHPPGLAVTCRVAEYEALATKLRLRAAICLQPLTSVQVERYFAAAGAGLELLRRALREDAGLRELARTPLMLSVMTLAWRDVPADAGHGGRGDSPEGRRRRLFDAYVEAALRRRGKAAGVESPEQTTRWLAWLAARMREHGQTLFAIEHLQPSWLAGAWSQGGYFLATRVLAAVALALPFLLWDAPVVAHAWLQGVAVLVGAGVAAVDGVFARWGWGGDKRASIRLGVLVGGFVTGFAVILPAISALLGRKSAAMSMIALYLALAGVALCTALDVRTLDVKPTASVRWAWRQAVDRFLLALIGTMLVVALVIALMIGTALTIGFASGQGGRMLAELFGDGRVAIGAAVVAGVVTWVWRRRRTPRTGANLLLAVALVILGGQLGFVLGRLHETSVWAGLVLQFVPAVVLGVFGGFTATMIDPTRSRPAGLWFWLRVPTMMFTLVGLIMLLPGFVAIYSGASTRRVPVWEALQSGVGVAVAFAGACGLAAFFRTGGFNGVQHFVLRWLLTRSGHLPRKAEAELERAAQAALLQKVGFGYRFIHALLLDHLAEKAEGERLDRAAKAGGPETPYADAARKPGDAPTPMA